MKDSSQHTRRMTWPEWSAVSRSGMPSRKPSKSRSQRSSAPTTKPSRLLARRRLWFSISNCKKEKPKTMKVPPPQPLRITGIESAQARDIAKGLLDAKNPRIAVGRLRTPQGVKSAVELAELVGASTSTAATNGPMSFPQRHPLCGPGADTNYDYTLGLETAGAQASVTGPGLATLLSRDAMNVGFGGIAPNGGGRQNGGGGRAGRGGSAAAPALALTADAETSLPGIIDEVKRQMTADKKR